MLIGIYSKKAAAKVGFYIYETPDGKRHYVTCISKNENWRKEYHWPDAFEVFRSADAKHIKRFDGQVAYRTAY